MPRIRDFFFEPEATSPAPTVELVVPSEVPPVTYVKGLLARGRFAPAVEYAYPRALQDVQLAYGTTFPPHWTHLEILRWGLPPSAPAMPDLLRRIYVWYEPLKYGPQPPSPGPQAGEDLVKVLQSLYGDAHLGRLYVTHTTGPPALGSTPSTPALPGGEPAAPGGTYL